jgi:NAD(P)-dependent dehydrogenase (short-subunit alcohol dehydrogenase family)
MDLGLKDKVAIVTGTGSQVGFGKGIALCLGREGCHVIGTDINIEGAEKTAAEVRALGVKSLAMKVDVSNRAEVDVAVKKTLAEFKKIDILVNNAGTDVPRKPFVEINMDDIKWTIGVNLYGEMNMVQAVAPHMISRKYGKIVNFSGGQGGPGMSAYSTSKGAVDAWSSSLAKELAPLGVHVNTFLPPGTKTGLGAAHLPPDFFDRMVKMSLLGRFCTPEEVGRMITFMVSDANSYMVGQLIKL